MSTPTSSQQLQKSPLSKQLMDMESGGDHQFAGTKLAVVQQYLSKIQNPNISYDSQYQPSPSRCNLHTVGSKLQKQRQNDQRQHSNISHVYPQLTNTRQIPQPKHVIPQHTTPTNLIEQRHMASSNPIDMLKAMEQMQSTQLDGKPEAHLKLQRQQMYSSHISLSAPSQNNAQSTHLSTCASRNCSTIQHESHSGYPYHQGLAVTINRPNLTPKYDTHQTLSSMGGRLAKQHQARDERQIPNQQPKDGRQMPNQQPTDGRQITNQQPVDGRQLPNQQTIDARRIQNQQMWNRRQIQNQLAMDGRLMINQQAMDRRQLSHQQAMDGRQISHQQAMDARLFLNQQPIDARQIHNQHPIDARQIPNQQPIDARQIPNQQPIDARQIPNQQPIDAGQIPNQQPIDARQIPNQQPIDARQIPNQQPIDARQIPNQQPIDASQILNKQSLDGQQIQNQPLLERRQIPNQQLFNTCLLDYHQESYPKLGKQRKLSPLQPVSITQPTSSEFPQNLTTTIGDATKFSTSSGTIQKQDTKICPTKERMINSASEHAASMLKNDANQLPNIQNSSGLSNFNKESLQPEGRAPRLPQYAEIIPTLNNVQKHKHLYSQQGQVYQYSGAETASVMTSASKLPVWTAPRRPSPAHISAQRNEKSMDYTLKSPPRAHCKAKIPQAYRHPDLHSPDDYPMTSFLQSKSSVPDIFSKPYDNPNNTNNLQDSRGHTFENQPNGMIRDTYIESKKSITSEQNATTNTANKSSMNLTAEREETTNLSELSQGDIHTILANKIKKVIDNGDINVSKDMCEKIIYYQNLLKAGRLDQSIKNAACISAFDFTNERDQLLKCHEILSDNRPEPMTAHHCTQRSLGCETEYKASLSENDISDNLVLRRADCLEIVPNSGTDEEISDNLAFQTPMLNNNKSDLFKANIEHLEKISNQDLGENNEGMAMATEKKNKLTIEPTLETNPQSQKDSTCQSLKNSDSKNKLRSILETVSPKVVSMVNPPKTAKRTKDRATNSSGTEEPNMNPIKLKIVSTASISPKQAKDGKCSKDVISRKYSIKKIVEDADEKMKTFVDKVSKKQELGKNNTSASHDEEGINKKRERMVRKFKKKNKVIPMTENEMILCKYCDIGFKDFFIFSLHTGCHKLSDPFTCAVCLQKCDNAVDFNLHLFLGH